MPYCRLYYHLVWATKDRLPLITPEIEHAVHDAIKRRVRSLGGETLAINGAEDHMHLAANIPPTVAISRFVSEVKGASSFHVNHIPGNENKLDWQRGYGALSFSHTDLGRIVEYIKRQKEHHSNGKVWASLENCGDEDTRKSLKVKEEQATYDPFCEDCEDSAAPFAPDAEASG